MTTAVSYTHLVFVEEMKKVFNVNEWGASWLQTYVELEPGVDLEQLNEKLKGLAFRKAGPACESIQIFLYPLNKMLLYGQFKDGIETVSYTHLLFLWCIAARVRCRGNDTASVSFWLSRLNGTFV